MPRKQTPPKNTLRMRRHVATGTVLVCIKTPRGNQWLSTGQTDYIKAHEVCTLAMIDQMQMAANANLLTSETLSRLLTGRRRSIPDIVNAWKAEVSERLAPDTLSAYEGALRTWIKECGLERDTLADVTAVLTGGIGNVGGSMKPSLSMWVNAAGIGLANRHSRLKALRSFYDFASAAGHCIGNPAKRVVLSQRGLLFAEIETKETVPMTDAEYRTIMASPEVKGFYRHATALSYWLALRLRDCACLEWDSIQKDRVVIFQKKTGSRLELPLDEPLLGGGELRGILVEMLEAKMLAPNNPFCFPSEREAILNPNKRARMSVYYQRLLQKNGIKGKRFHSLRHAAAMRLAEAGKSLTEIGKVLGHKSEQTTRIYVNHAPKADAV